MVLPLVTQMATCAIMMAASDRKNNTFLGDHDKLCDIAHGYCYSTNNEASWLVENFDDALSFLKDNSLVKATAVPNSSGYYKIDFTLFEELMKDSASQFELFQGAVVVSYGEAELNDYPAAYVKEICPLLYDYYEFGDEWLLRMLQDFDGLEVVGQAEPRIVPASDRIVLLNDNQKAKLVEKAEEIITELETQTNRAIDGDPNLFDRIIGQLKASKELFFSGCVRVQIIHLALIETLQLLAARYVDTIIGGLATELIIELAKVGFS
jgi:hypothetical protein